jgi:hypothetical protein
MTQVHCFRKITVQVKYYLVAIGYEINGIIERGARIDDKKFISAKLRVCSFAKAARFSNPNEARILFHKWISNKQDSRLRLDLVELVEPRDFEIKLYDESHPLWTINENAPKSSIKYANAYYFDYLKSFLLVPSGATIKKHRNILLGFGVDIFKPLPENLNLAVKIQKFQNTPNDLIATWDGKWVSQPQLKVVGRKDKA